MSWTKEKEEKLKDLWKKGHSGSQIANILGNTTRNAVIGKAHRLQLQARITSRKISTKSTKEKEKDSTPEVKNQKLGRKARFKALLLDKNFEQENPKKLEELNDNTCKWPIGHPYEKNFYFCGRSSLKDFSYCKLHLLYAYQPKGKKEDVTEKDEVPEFIEKKIKSA